MGRRKGMGVTSLMSTLFIKEVASVHSLNQRNYVQGVGVNDSWYKTNKKVEGVVKTCPVYKRWGSMLYRCYSEKYHARFPTYKDCTVCDEWLLFSNFSCWYEENYVAGWDLDKDIISKGNKVYSPEQCLFVPPCVNYLLVNSNTYKGKQVSGVTREKGGRYKAQVSSKEGKRYLGVFEDIGDAHNAYVSGKNEEIVEMCIQYPSIAKHLKKHLL